MLYTNKKGAEFKMGIHFVSIGLSGFNHSKRLRLKVKKEVHAGTTRPCMHPFAFMKKFFKYRDQKQMMS